MLQRDKHLYGVLRFPGFHVPLDVCNQPLVQRLVPPTPMDMGDHDWDMMIDGYLHSAAMRAAIDKRYGEGASDFIGKALRFYRGGADGRRQGRFTG